MASDLPLFVHSSIDDMTDLTPNAMRVYMHLARRADSDGVAWPSYQAIGDHCFSSVSDNTATRKTFARKAIDELVTAGVIGKENRERPDGGQSSNGYRLAPIQGESDPVLIKHGGVLNNTPVLNGHDPCLINTPHAYEGTEGNPIEGTPNEGERERAQAPRPPAKTPSVDDDVEFVEGKPVSDLQAMYAAICEALGWDYHVISEKAQVDVAETVKTFAKANYTANDVRRFMTEVWAHDWRCYDKKERPKLKDIREGIGNLRIALPESRARASPSRATSNAAANRQAVANVVNRLKSQQGKNGHG